MAREGTINVKDKQHRRSEVIRCFDEVRRRLANYTVDADATEAAKLAGLIPELREVALRFERATARTPTELLGPKDGDS